MVQSKAKTVADYLKELPPERRKVIAAVRKLIRSRLPPGYQEVPAAKSPKTCNGEPLIYAGLAAQKNNYSLYLMCLYAGELQSRLREAIKKSGKKPDMGKACIRFKSLDDLPLDVIGDLIAAVPMKRYLSIFEECRSKRK